MRKALAAILVSCVATGPGLCQKEPFPKDPPSSSGGVDYAAFSPDSKLLATYTRPSRGEVQNVLILWDLSKAQTDKGERKGVLWKAEPFEYEKTKWGTKDPPAFYSLSFSPDGKHVLVAGGSHGKEMLRKFATRTGKLVEEHPLPKLTRAAFAAGGAVLAGVQDFAARYWSTAEGKQRGEGHPGPFNGDIRPSPDGTRFLAWSWDGGVTEYEFAAGKPSRKVGAGVASGRFPPEYVPGLDAVFVRGTKADWLLIDTNTGKERSLPGPLLAATWRHQFVFSPDGKRVVWIVEDGGATVHDASSGKELYRLPRSFVLECKDGDRFSGIRGDVCFSPDSKLLVVTGKYWGTDGSGRVRLTGDRTAILTYDAASGKPLRTIAFPPTPPPPAPPIPAPLRLPREQP